MTVATETRTRLCEMHQGDTYLEGCWGCDRLVEIEEGNVEVQRLRRALREAMDDLAEAGG